MGASKSPDFWPGNRGFPLPGLQKVFVSSFFFPLFLKSTKPHKTFHFFHILFFRGWFARSWFWLRRPPPTYALPSSVPSSPPAAATAATRRRRLWRRCRGGNCGGSCARRGRGIGWEASGAGKGGEGGEGRESVYGDMRSMQSSLECWIFFRGGLMRSASLCPWGKASNFTFVRFAVFIQC